MPSSSFDAPDMSGLIELSRDPQLDLKPVVLRVQTDLFLAAPIRDRAALEAFGSLATGLIPTVDEETALIVARKLAPCADTPESVLVRLAEWGGEIAEAVLASAPQPSALVIEAARQAGVDVGAALAARAGAETPSFVTSDDAEDDLSDTFETGMSAGNLSRLLSNARKDPELARSVLDRADLSPSDLAPLWLHADMLQRAAIGEAVEATSALRPCPPAPRNLAATLTACSTERDVSGFVAALSNALGLSKDFLGAAPDASSRYDLLALALRAADLPDSDAIYIFLTLNETVARSVQRVFALAQLYRSTGRGTARDLLSAVLDMPLPERTASGEHRPYLGADAAKPRYAASSERLLGRTVAAQRLRRTV